MSDLLQKTAADLGREIEAGRVDPKHLTEAFLSAIEAHELAPRIYARTTADRARAEAAAASDRAKAGLRRGPLDGVPLSWKDLFDTAGTVTEAGSKMLEGRTPEDDAICLERATRAGTVCLGKTHLSELAFSGLGVNPVTATAPNRYDPDAAPGGSSSGAAASIAYGLAPAGIGSDTGGSVRIPAAWNGLVGLKTTAGLIPLDGAVPLSVTLDTIGPLTRSVEDAALLTSIMAATPVPDLDGASVKGERFLVAETVMLDGCEPEVTAGFEAMVERLGAAGAVIDRGPVPEFAEALEVAGATGGIVSNEAYALWGGLIGEKGDLMFPRIRERFMGGAQFSAADAETARMAFERLSKAFSARAAGYAAVLAPTSPIRPPKVQRLIDEPDFFTQQNMAALRNTRIGNFLKLCALTLPTEADAVGLMLMAPGFNEARLLRLGAAIEVL